MCEFSLIGDSSDPLMKLYPLVFQYHANGSEIPLDSNTALPDAAMTMKSKPIRQILLS